MANQSAPQSVYAVGRQRPDHVDLLGTAFVLARPGKLATAAHVIGRNDKDLVVVQRRITYLSEYQDTSNNEVNVAPAVVVAVDPFRDLCILKVPGPIQSRLTVVGTDAIEVGTEVDVYGFPHADYGRYVLTYQATNIGSKILVNNGGIKVKYLVLNMQTRPGQSGSPILRRPDSSVVGILIGSYSPIKGERTFQGVDPTTLHQTTHAVSAEYLLEMMET